MTTLTHAARTILGVIACNAAMAAVLLAQPAGRHRAPDTAATRARTTILRDVFIDHVRSAGFTCPIAAPRILVEDVPSFGRYDDATNTLHTSDWTLLRPDEKESFKQLAGPKADDEAVHEVFEKAAHGWIFAHEMGHWWQACEGYTAHHSHYQAEYGANRIALAFWRDLDPSVVTLMGSLFHHVVDDTPSPVPAGAEVEEYFNTNYEALGPTPAYPWFQAHMGLALEQEKPNPTWKAVLASTKNAPPQR